MDCHAALSSQGFLEAPKERMHESTFSRTGRFLSGCPEVGCSVENTVLRGQCLAGPRRGMECQEVYLDSGRIGQYPIRSLCLRKCFLKGFIHNGVNV